MVARRLKIQPRGTRGRFSSLGEESTKVVGVRIPVDIKDEFMQCPEDEKGAILDLLREYIRLAVENLPDEVEVNQDFPSNIELTEDSSKVLGVRVLEGVKKDFDSLERWERSRILEGTRSFLVHLLVTGGEDTAGYLAKRRALPRRGWDEPLRKPGATTKTIRKSRSRRTRPGKA